MSRYNAEEQAVLTQAKKTHKETTASAQRALATANQTRQLATDTLEEIHRQGEKIDKIDRDLTEIKQDVKEAKSLLAFMRRCCCCGLCCDADVERDKTRKQRLQARNEMRAVDKEVAEMGRGPQKSETAYAGKEEAVRRAELLNGSANGKERVRAGDRAARRIGEGLEDKDRDEIQRETKVQEDAIDGISSALDDLARMGNQMGESLDGQMGRVDKVGQKAETTHDDIRSVQRGARRDFRLKVK